MDKSLLFPIGVNNYQHKEELNLKFVPVRCITACVKSNRLSEVPPTALIHHTKQTV